MTILQRFWNWYEKYYLINVGVATFLFAWQLFHLYWLTTDVVVGRLFGESLFSPTDFWRFIIAIIDYTEIPAILTTPLVYINELHRARQASSHTKSGQFKPILYLILLNSQWIHLFWLTDEVVVTTFQEEAPIKIPVVLAWIAILIDYLELPVIFETTRKFVRALRAKLNTNYDGRGDRI